MTLDELERLVTTTLNPKDLWGDDKAGWLKKVRVLTHPDRYPGDAAGAERAVSLFQRVEKLVKDLNKVSHVIKSPKRVYHLDKLIKVGDVADVYMATAEGETNRYIVKLSRVIDGLDLLENESKAIRSILGQAGRTKYDRYLPTICEDFEIRDGIRKRVNVFLWEPGFYGMETVHEQHPNLSPWHLAWIFKRILVITGFTHKYCGRIHGAICPAHVLIHVENHGVKLVGWGQSVAIGGIIKSGSAAYMDWYPPEVKQKKRATEATDIYMAAMCILYLSGGNVERQTMPKKVPDEMRRFIMSLIIEGPSMRPKDAWVLCDEFDDMLMRTFGPPKFRNLNMPQVIE